MVYGDITDITLRVLNFNCRLVFSSLASERTAMECWKSYRRIEAELRSNGWLQPCLCLLILITFSYCALYVKYHHSSISISNHYSRVLLCAISVILVVRTCLNQFNSSTVDLLIICEEEEEEKEEEEEEEEEGNRNMFAGTSNFNVESVDPVLLR